MAREIPLTRGHVAIVDDEDFERVAAHRWHIVPSSPSKTYARRHVQVPGRGLRGLYMHRFLAGAPAGVVVDHRNGDSLDNRRANLRLATPSLNCVNRRDYKPASGYRGVYGKDGRWRAVITSNSRNHALGAFADKVDAARAYDAAALEFFGEFAVLNFPPHVGAS